LKRVENMRERKRKPVHPGRIMKNHHLIPLSLSLTELAEILGVSRKTVSKIVNERGAITPDMALRLSRAFDTTPDLWLGLQQEFDLWHAAHGSQEWLRVKAVKGLSAVA
jgi:addiction module HigA family antidote